MSKIEKTNQAIEVKMVTPKGKKAKRVYQYEIDSFQRLGEEIKITPKANATVSKDGFKLEFYVPTINVVIGIGNNETADLVMSVQAWKALLNGADIHITTTEEFKKKYVYKAK